MKSASIIRRRQNLGYLIGFTIGLGLLALFVSSGWEDLHMRGPMNTGHEKLNCIDCHEPAPGTIRQQIQANVRYLLNLREQRVDFGHHDVGNGVCLNCHERPNDRHPVFRFFEPRFEKARQAIQPHLCASCHLEHTGKRVTIEPTFCVNCHRSLTLKKDPLTMSHEALIAADKWDRCLRCHDFHGNYRMLPKAALEEMFTSSKLLTYFDGGPAPYAEVKYYRAKQEIADD